MRSISRVTGASINTVTKLLIDAGEVSLALHDDQVRGLTSKRIQCDEIWSFCYAKARNVGHAATAPEGAGDVWTWTALDPDSKLMVSYVVGDRSSDTALVLMTDIKARVLNRFQLTTDGHAAYLEATAAVFGEDIDYGRVVKIYGPVGTSRKNPRLKCIDVLKTAEIGRPELRHICTSHMERANLTIRMQNRRFARSTNAFSKKFDNHVHALALGFAYYNFCRIHTAHRTSPAMAAGIADRLWSLEDIVDLIDERRIEKLDKSSEAAMRAKVDADIKHL